MNICDIMKCYDHFKGKPKLFFIQACRNLESATDGAKEKCGESTAAGTEPQNEETRVQNKVLIGAVDRMLHRRSASGLEMLDEETITEKSHPVTGLDHIMRQILADGTDFEDMLIAYATSPGQPAGRSEAAGSPFIQILCDKLSSGDQRMDLITLLKEVHSILKADFKQQCEIRNFLSKNLFLI